MGLLGLLLAVPQEHLDCVPVLADSRGDLGEGDLLLGVREVEGRDLLSDQAIPVQPFEKEQLISRRQSVAFEQILSAFQSAEANDKLCCLESKVLDERELPAFLLGPFGTIRVGAGFKLMVVAEGAGPAMDRRRNVNGSGRQLDLGKEGDIVAVAQGRHLASSPRLHSPRRQPRDLIGYPIRLQVARH